MAKRGGKGEGKKDLKVARAPLMLNVVKVDTGTFLS